MLVNDSGLLVDCFGIHILGFVRLPRNATADNRRCNVLVIFQAL